MSTQTDFAIKHLFVQGKPGGMQASADVFETGEVRITVRVPDLAALPDDAVHPDSVRTRVVKLNSLDQLGELRRAMIDINDKINVALNSFGLQS